MDVKQLALSAAMLPLVASVVVGLGNKHIKRQLAHLLSNAAVGLSCMASLYLLRGFIRGEFSPTDFELYTWGSSGGLKFQVGFMIDMLSVVMMTVVTSVSFMVHIYTIGYMHEDRGYQRFFAYISLFTSSMLMLVMSNNLLQLFFGWEAVGVVSYLLIGFWFKRDSASAASLKAFLVNRLGDVFFLIGIACLIMLTQSTQYRDIFQTLPQLIQNRPSIALNGALQIDGLSFAALALFIGAMAKSAQIPLHNWLPDSMEGPTPISALIHAATMVTAGIFMVSRLSYLYQACPDVLNLILITGATTSLLMGLLGLVQSDIKRVIAYSTLSQLGYMVAALGVSHYDRAIFHLFTHAFFKALLFLSAGAVILRLHHEQNIWKMGNLKKYMPITYLCFLIGTLSLCGFPGSSGFFSKDLIIDAVRDSNLPAASGAFYALIAGVFVTALYSFRLLLVVFHTDSRVPAHTLEHLHEAPKTLTIPLMVLAVPAALVGLYTVDALMAGLLHSSIGRFAPNDFDGAWAMVQDSLSQAPTWCAISGALTACLFYKWMPCLPRFCAQRLSFLHQIMLHKYGFDALYNDVCAGGTRLCSWVMARVIDQYLIDRTLVNGSAKIVMRFARWLKLSQTGLISQYALTMVLGLLVLLAWLLVHNFDTRLIL